MINTIQFLLPDLTFKHLNNFASFIQCDKLDEFTNSQLTLAKELGLPILKFFEKLSEQEVIELSKQEQNRVLEFLANNNAKEFIKFSIARWLENKLPVIEKHNLEARDLSLLVYIRKQAFLKLIPSFTTDINTVLELVKEIEKFSLEEQSATITIYMELLHERITESEALYKQAEALTHIGNWKWMTANDVVEWSDELFRIHEMEPHSEKITFDKVLSFLDEADRDKMKHKVSICLEEKQPFEIYYRINLPQNKTKYLYGKGEVILDENGTPKSLFGTAQDITEEYITRSLLEENQKYIEKITDAAPSIMVVYSAKTSRFSFASKALETVLGYNQKELLKEGPQFFTRSIHPQDLETVIEKNKKAIELANDNESLDKKEVITELTYRLKSKDGKYKWLQTFATILDRDSDGKVDNMLYIALDITEKVEAEKKIKEQEHWIQRIADASPTILYVYDLDKRSIVYINKEVNQVLNYTPAEVLEMGENFFTILFHPDEFEAIDMHHRKVVTNPEKLKGVDYEVRMRHKTGGWKHILLKEIVFKVNDSTGEVCQVLCAALDISERKQMERALFEKTMELHQSNKSLEEFAYVASHDLKEPLRKISAFGDRLLTSYEDKLDTNGQFFLNRIIDSSKRMNTMIDDLLSLSTISSQKEFKSHSLQSILDEVLQLLEFKIEKRKAIISYDELPTAKIVASQFRQLFQNLITNALKFVADDVTPEIKIICKILSKDEVAQHKIGAASKYLQLQFVDNGIGFEQQYAERIFVVFQRLHGRSEYDGTGIGLAICKKIMENHGGIIFANSTPGEGATFTIVFPLYV